MNLRRNIFIIMVMTVLSAIYGQNDSSAFDRGESLFRSNQPQQAIPLFEQTLDDPSVNPSVYVYLGIAYYQTGNFQKSLDVCLQGLDKSGTNKRVLAFNAGNSAFALGNYAKAEECYRLAIAADATYAAPVLNRSNAILKQGRIQDAITSYEQFVAMAPDDEQTAKVRQLIEALKNEQNRQAQAAAQQVQEAARVKAESERLAAEKAEADRVAAETAAAEKAAQEQKAKEEAAAAAERRRKLLEDVAASLQDTDTKNMTAGTEDVMEYQNESGLE